jgi:hypothetical protein
MNRLMLAILALLASVAPAAAQGVRPDDDPSAVGTGARPEVSSVQRPRLFGNVSAPQQPAPPPAREINLSGPRRRGSMVGYIDDTIVSSKIRLRFDVGLHNHAPDRAEFFYAKCGCYRDLPAGDPAFDPKAPGPGPGAADDLNFQQFYVEGEYAATDRVSVFAELPLRWLQPQTIGVFKSQSGLSDLRGGARFAIADTDQQMLTLQLKAFLPTGDALRGLGTDHASVEPMLLYHQELSDRASVESQFGLWLPFGGSDGVPTSSEDKFAGKVLSYGIGPSVDVYSNGDVRIAPVVELVGWRVLNGFQTSDPGDASGINIVNLKFGARGSWGRGSSIYAGYGHALTKADWYNDIFRFEYRFSF